MDIQGSYQHYGKIYPFHDAPDQAVDVLWYPVPEDWPAHPYPHPFLLRGWDQRNEEPEPVIGTRYEPFVAYTGPGPLPYLGDVCGTPEQWLNGVSYADYLAGAYACDCPEPPMPSYVSSLACDDDSIFVSAPTGAVVIHLNPASPNHWTIPQFFSSGNILLPGIYIDYQPGQTGAVFVVRDAASHVLAGIYPALFVGDSLALVMRNLANQTGATVCGFTIQLVNNPAGTSVQINNFSAIAELSALYWWMVPQAGYGGLYGSWVVGPGIDTSFIASIDADWVQYSAFSGATYADVLVGDRGGGPELLRAGTKDGYYGQMGNHAAGSLTPDPKFRYFGVMDPSFGGFVARQTDSHPQGVTAFEAQNNAGDLLWAIDDEGQLRSSQVQSPTGTGGIIGRLEVRDKTGAVIGYLPVYDTL